MSDRPLHAREGGAVKTRIILNFVLEHDEPLGVLDSLDFIEGGIRAARLTAVQSIEAGSRISMTALKGKKAVRDE